MSIQLQRSLFEMLNISSYQQGDPILNAILDRIGEKNDKLRHVGEGGSASVYWMSDKKKVFKITTDRTDANAAMIVKKRPDKSLVEIYDVFEIDKAKRVYGIVAEKLTPLTGAALEMIERLSYMFDGSDITDKEEVARRVELAKRKNVPLFEEDLKQLALFSKALSDRHIVWGADFHEYNVMMRGRTLVIIEFGYGISPPQSIPQLQVSGA